MSHSTLVRRRSPEVSTAVVRTQSTEEREYQRRVRQIAARQRRFTELEAEVAELRRALSHFASLCDARVGDLMSELRWVGRLAADYEQRVQRLRFGYPPDRLGRPLDGDEDDPFATGDDSDAEATRAESSSTEQAAERPPVRRDRQTEADAKRVYRDLAKRCHPDYAQSDSERTQREAIMQRVNEAFRDRDLSALQELQQTTEADDPAFAARSPRERIAWATAEVVRLDTLLAALKTELTVLHGFEMYRLWQRHEAGKPVLALLEDDLEARLSAETRRLDRLIAAYRSTLDERERLAAG